MLQDFGVFYDRHRNCKDGLEGTVLLATPLVQSVTFVGIDCPTDLLHIAGEDQARGVDQTGGA